MSIDLRLGRWEDVLTDVECDALICDPPYSERTHAGHNSKAGNGLAHLRALDYEPWTPETMTHFIESWHPRVRGWMVIMTDHVLARVVEEVFQRVGRHAFAPVPLVEMGRSVRVCGDGPACWAVQVMVARPKTAEAARWRALPGAYVVGSGRAKGRLGGKPIDVMRALVRDYSRPGDMICDPCAGHGTTLRAALAEGRRAVGAEMDEETWRRAMGGNAPLLEVNP